MRYILVESFLLVGEKDQFVCCFANRKKNRDSVYLVNRCIIVN